MKKIYLLFILCSIFSFGQTTFNAGEVFVVGYRGDGGTNGGTPSCGDGFAITSFVDIAPNTELRISEEDFDQWGGSEGEILWNSGASTIPALTTISFTTHTSSSAGNECPSSSVSHGSFTYDFASWNLGFSNEELYIYQSTQAATVQTFIISAFFTDTPGALPGTGILSSSHIINIQDIDSDADIAVYSGALTFTDFADFISQLTDESNNWDTQDGSLDNGVDGVYPEYPSDLPSFSTLSINDGNTFTDAFKIYPNPVNGSFFNIVSRIEGLKSVIISDVLGKQVLKARTLSNVNISNLKDGIYIIRVNQGNQSVTRKLIIN